MSDLTPNKHPDGEKCGTCRFAGTHVHAGSDDATKVRVRCLRYPPTRRGEIGKQHPMKDQEADTFWPVLTWDDWCGEWVRRDGDIANWEAVLRSFATAGL